jgi:glucose/arabinose dehydrogenase
MRRHHPHLLLSLWFGTLALAVAGCGGAPPSNDTPAAAAPPALRLETVASGLETPWAMSFAPDGRIFVTERPGRVRVIEPSGLVGDPWAEVGVVSSDYRSEGGLLGIAVSPDFATSGHVFVVGTFAVNGQLINRILRFTDRDGRGVDQTVIVGNLPAVTAEPGSERAIHTHVGGALGFGPDGMLYTTTGDATRPELSQDPASLAGKLLRYRPDGTVPDDNPTPGSPVYALGLRNPQGLAWSADTGVPFVAEHGPSELSWETSGGWFGDEANAIGPGLNYGWPDVQGTGGTGAFVDPLVEWSPSVGPSSLTVYSGTAFPWRGDLLVANLRGERLVRIPLVPDPALATGWRAASQEPLLENRVGRIRIVATGPDGQLYIANSNRDGRGKAEAEDDRIFRVLPE